ncbi:hypothetical protein ACQP1W_25075 [Spirillospora sp. CA-255316]
MHETTRPARNTTAPMTPTGTLQAALLRLESPHGPVTGIHQPHAMDAHSPSNRTNPFGVVITWLEKDWTG